jgi:type III pantothenate kinase
LTHFRKDCFGGEASRVIATGGFAGLYADAGLFSAIHPDLVLEGVRIAMEMNS